VGVFGIPCEEVIGLVDIKGGEGRGIMEGVNVAFANNGTNWNVSTLHNKIEGVGVGCFSLDCMRSWLQPLSMEHHLSKKRIFIEIPDQYKPGQRNQREIQKWNDRATSTDLQVGLYHQ